jgi:hypothetical protein
MGAWISKSKNMMDTINKDEVICNICLDVAYKPMVSVACNHLFCKGCIQKWIIEDFVSNTKSTCPNCRIWIEFYVPDEVLKIEEFRHKFKSKDYIQLEENNIEPILNFFEECCRMDRSKILYQYCVSYEKENMCYRFCQHPLKSKPRGSSLILT